MTDLNDLLTCGAPWAEQRAKIAIELQAQYDAGKLSKGERDELLQDLINTDILDSESDDINVKAALIAGISGVISVV